MSIITENEKPQMQKDTLERLIDRAQHHIDDAKLHYDDSRFCDAVVSCCAFIHIIGKQFGPEKPGQNLSYRINQGLDIIRISLGQMVEEEIEDKKNYDKVRRVMKFLKKDDLLRGLQIPQRTKALLHRFVGDLAYKEQDYETAQQNYKASLTVKATKKDSVRVKIRGKSRLYKKLDFETRIKLAYSYLDNSEELTEDLDYQIQNSDSSDMQSTFSEIEAKLKGAARTFRKIAQTDRRRVERRDARIKLGYVRYRQAELYSKYPRFLKTKDWKQKAEAYAAEARKIFIEELNQHNITRVMRSPRFTSKRGIKQVQQEGFEDPMDDNLHYYLGSLYLTGLLGKNEKAKQAFIESAKNEFGSIPEISPFYDDSRLKLAIALCTEDGKTVYSDESKLELEKLILRQPENVEAILRLGDLFRVDNRFIEAVDHYNRAYALSEGNPYLQFNTLFWVSYCIERLKITGPTALSPVYERTQRYLLIKLADTQKKIGNLKDAIDSCKLVLASDNVSDEEKVEANKRLAEAYFRLNQVEDALEPLKQSVRIESRNPQAHFAYGVAQYIAGDYKGAGSSFSTAHGLLQLKDASKGEGLTLDDRLLLINSLFLQGCSLMSRDERKTGLTKIIDALVKAYELPDIADRIQEGATGSQEVLTLAIQDHLSMKIKKGPNVRAESEKSNYIYEKLDKKSLISLPLPLVRNPKDGTENFVSLTLTGTNFVEALRNFKASEDYSSIRRYAIKAIAIMARFHHELNFSHNKTHALPERVFERTDSVQQTIEDALFDSRRYAPLQEFSGIDRTSLIWQGIKTNLKGLDSILYCKDNLKNPLLYGINHGDYHCGNIMRVTHLKYDPKFKEDDDPYICLIDNDQAHYDLFFSDIYDFVEDVRNQLDATDINNYDLVRLYFAFRCALMHSTSGFKEVLQGAMNGEDRFMGFAEAYQGDVDIEKFVEMYQTYAYIRDIKTFGMFKAYEEDPGKSPSKDVESIYRHKCSQSLRNFFKGNEAAASKMTEEAKGFEQLRGYMMQYVSQGRLKRYLTYTRMPERDLEKGKPFESLLKAA